MEQTVATIYSIFMKKFPEEKSFWEDLFNDEAQHQSILTSAEYIESIDLLPSKDIVPSIKLIESSLRSAAYAMSTIKSGTVTLEDALRTALYLEESMVEMFANELMAKIFSFDYKSLSGKLIAAERLHIDKIEDMMIKKGFLQMS